MDYTQTAEWNKQNNMKRLEEQKQQKERTNSCNKCQHRLPNGACAKKQNSSKPCKETE